MKKYKNVLIYGYGKSGQAVKKVLEEKKINYSIYDKKMIDDKQYIYKLSKKKLLSFDLIVISPGISIYDKYVKLAVKNKIEVISELEFGFRLKSKKSKIIAITGTNGKTTTVSMLNDCLLASSKNSIAAGNIGLPLSAVASNNYDYIVCEVSSFQLEAVQQFKADIACIINIDEDHLDRHKKLENYINCKLKIFNNQSPSSYSIINLDDKYSNLALDLVKNRKVFTSKTPLKNGCFIEDDVIKYKRNKKEFNVIGIDDIKLPKVFFDDILIVCAICKLLGVENKHIFEVIDKYSNLPNKSEVVAGTSDILVINDSKATNTHAVLESASNLSCDVLLMLGGKDKELSFDNFFKKLPSNVKTVVAYGEVKSKIAKAAKRNNFNNIYLADKLYEACDMAVALLKKGQAILFSPACSSFDEFLNYAERGEFFKKTIRQMLGNQ